MDKTQPAIRDRIKELRRVKASELLPNPSNWRTHPQAQSAALSAVLREVGYADALLARETPEGLRLIDGHLRQKLTPDQEVPVLVLDVDEAEANKILVTLDPLASLAGADKQALDALLHEVSTGDAALQEMLSGLAAENGLTYGTQEPATTPEPQIDRAEELQKKWRTELGQLWQIGRHRLLCGDATKAEDVARVLNGAKPHLMVTDPPYGVDYKPTWRDEAGGQFGDGKTVMRGSVDNDDRTDWTEAWALFPGDVVYVWHAGIFAGDVALQLASVRLFIRTQIVWVKPHFIMSRGAYHWQHEPCWYAVRRSKRSGWIGDRSQSTTWQIAGMNPAGGSHEEKLGHGTQKPLECMARPIRNHEGDVYDPFVGVGTTIVAAEQLKRTCYAIDVDPKWVAVSLQRLADMGLKPLLADRVTQQTYVVHSSAVQANA